MMLRVDSPLLLPPRALNERHVVMLDGIARSCLIMDHAYRRLVGETLVRIMELAVDVDMEPHRTAALLDAWAIVDAANRMDQLLRYMFEHGPKREASEPGSGIDYTKWVEDTHDIRALRNGIQHVANRLEQPSKYQNPLWGSLQWVAAAYVYPAPLRVFVMPSGPQLREMSARTVATGEFAGARPPVDCVTLQAFNRFASLTKLIECVTSLVHTLEGQLDAQFDGLPRRGHFGFFHLEFEPILGKAPRSPVDPDAKE